MIEDYEKYKEVVIASPKPIQTSECCLSDEQKQIGKRHAIQMLHNIRASMKSNMKLQENLPQQIKAFGIMKPSEANSQAHGDAGAADSRKKARSHSPPPSLNNMDAAPSSLINPTKVISESSAAPAKRRRQAEVSLDY